MQKAPLAAVCVVCALPGVNVARAQRGGGDWMTSGFDAQRSSWVRSDAKISRESLQKPGFELVWKLKFDNAPRQLNTLTPPALLDFYIGYRGFRALGFFGGSSDRVIAVDLDLARIEWEKNFGTGSTAAGTLPCPGGITSAVTRPTNTAYPMVPTGRGLGRSTPAKSGVGLPNDGAVTLKPVSVAPPPPRPAKPAAAEFNPFAPRVQWLLALTSDGKLHSMWVSNGEEPNSPVQFVPPNAHAVGLVAYENAAYVATTNGCGGVEDGVWALNLETKKVSHWKSGASIPGTAGFASGPDGTVYVAAGNELTALAARTLDPVASYKSERGFSSTPVVFDFKGRNLIAIGGKDGRLYLLDSAALKEPLDRTAPFSDPEFSAGSLASWQDPSGTRWILAPAGGAAATSAGLPAGNGEVKNGAITAWKIVEKEGKIGLEAAWASRDLVSPLPPIIINGVVFALSSGEFRSTDSDLSVAQRAKRSTNAVLYALDPANGKELWNSGNTMSSFVHSGGLSAGGSRVYVSTYEGTQYVFGFPIEH